MMSLLRMARKTYRPTFMRGWREKEDLTLRQVVERMKELHNVILTPTSLSRIERGLQPYSQEILEAVVDAIGKDPATLLMRDPDDPEGIWSIWDRIEPAKRPAALDALTGIADSKRKAGNG